MKKKKKICTKKSPFLVQLSSSSSSTSSIGGLSTVAYVLFCFGLIIFSAAKHEEQDKMSGKSAVQGPTVCGRSSGECWEEILLINAVGVTRLTGGVILEDTPW